MAGDGALSGVCEWVIPDGMLTPADSVAAVGDAMSLLNPTRVFPTGRAAPGSSLSACWPFRHQELVSQLQRVGLGVETTTSDPGADGYLVVAVTEDAQGGCAT